MVAIRALDWDVFATQLRSIVDAVGENYYDRPGSLDQELYQHFVDDAHETFETVIAPKLQDNDAAAIASVFTELHALSKSDDYFDATGKVEAIFNALPELNGRFERYEAGVMRRKSTAVMTHHSEVLKTLFNKHSKGEAALFFDLDGSLAHAEPGRNTGYDEDARLQFVLNRLNVQSESATAVVTGRPEMFLQQVFPNGTFFSATEHGVFVRERVGGNVVRSYQGGQNVAALKKLVADQMKDRGLSEDECYVEQEKEGSVTVQFTNAADPMAAALHIGEILQMAAFSPVNARSADPFMIVDGNVPGNRVMDLVPQSADKGATLEWLYDTYPHIFKGKVPVMVGDSGGDETAMAWVKAQGGIAIGVGENAPDIADIKLSGLQAARDLFTSLAEEAANVQRNANTKPYRLVI